MSIEQDLEITWRFSIFLFLFLGVVCLILAWLERPLKEKGDIKTRQIYAFTTLILLALSLLCRTVWTVFKLKQYSPSYPSQTGLFLSYLSRLSECLLYSSCLVMCMQYCMLCGKILNWQKSTFLLWRRSLILLNTIFYGFYLGTAHIAYEAENPGEVKFDRYDDLFVSSFFTISAVALVYSSRQICNAMSRWSAINNSDETARPSSTAKSNSALKHALRLYRCCLIIGIAYLLRAGSWAWSPITNEQGGPYPWFYPLCFYQYPTFMISCATMCIVGNLDVRIIAISNIIYSSLNSRVIVHIYPNSNKLRASYVQEEHQEEHEDQLSYRVELAENISC